MPIKKRRVVKSPNKNFQKSMRRQNEDQDQSGGTLSVRYPNVESISIKLEFTSPEGHILGDESRSFKPSDSLNLWATCPGRCGNGRINLETKISQIINSRQTYFETKDICNEVIHVGANDACKSLLKCQVKIGFAAPAPAAPL